MSKEYRINKAEEGINQLMKSMVMPSIKRAFANDKNLVGVIDSKKLITEITFSEDSPEEMRLKQEKEKQIEQIFPYYNELVELGVSPLLIKNHFYMTTEETPYNRDLLNNPTRLNMQKSKPSSFRYPELSVARLIAELDTLGLPQIKEVTDPEVKSRSKEFLKENVINSFLKRIIADSGLKFDDPRFDHIKTKISQDIDDDQTGVFLFGEQILGLLPGQKPDYCAFSTGGRINHAIAHLLAMPIIKNALINMKIDPISTNEVMRTIKKENEEDISIIKDEIGIDMNQNLSSTDNENYRLLLKIFTNSEIRLLTLITFNCND